MGTQVVALFQRQESVAEVVQLLHASGYGHKHVELVSKDAPSGPDLSSQARQVRTAKLLERPEGMLPSALRWAIIGS